MALDGTAAGAQATQAALASRLNRRGGGRAGICQSARHPAPGHRRADVQAASSRRWPGAPPWSAWPSTTGSTGITCKFHPHWQFDSASVVKVTILSALLRKLQQEHRSLTAAQRKLATEMITVSDNDAASTLWAETGTPSLQHFLDLAGMKETDARARAATGA